MGGRKHPIPIMVQGSGTRNNDADLTWETLSLCPCYDGFYTILLSTLLKPTGTYLYFPFLPVSFHFLGLSQLLRLLLPLQTKIMKANKRKPPIIAVSRIDAHLYGHIFTHHTPSVCVPLPLPSIFNIQYSYPHHCFPNTRISLSLPTTIHSKVY